MFQASDDRPKMKVYVGCSGWFYWHWRGRFYPETLRTDKWFRHHTENFRTVELNAPFYRWPKLATAKSWRRAAPSVEELETWARRIHESGAHQAWIYFDNGRDAFAIKNARQLIDGLRKLGLDESQ